MKAAIQFLISIFHPARQARSCSPLLVWYMLARYSEFTEEFTLLQEDMK
ncbi:MAG: hypothetical protein Q8L93_05990 [Rhodocyclaceae bacterium]|nr:hypothetical protein [Rhodocyclaceae bacterium]